VFSIGGENIMKSPQSNKTIEMDFDKHVDKCLSMIIHIKEVEEIAEVIKKVHSEAGAESPLNDGDD
jgi:hypothetical protein